MVYQHFTLIPGMTVLENLVMARAEVPKIINWREERNNLLEFLDTVPFDVRLDIPASALAVGEKQKVEILKQLYLNSRFLILDEPTSVLTPQEADEILGLVREMARDGSITALIITHKFSEVTAFADEVTVLRRGQVVGSGGVADLNPEDLARMMIGDDELTVTKPRAETKAGAVKLELQALSADNDSGHAAIRGVDLKVHIGEIVGIAGVSGNGQSELVQVIAGQRIATGGGVHVHGEPYGASRKESERHKLFCLPEEPLANACVAEMSVAENMAFRTFDRPGFAAGGWWLKRGAFQKRAGELIARYNIKTPGPDASISQLSGGNIQRTVLARELSGDVEILIAANPCFGLDFSAVADIHAQLMEVRNRGAAVLLVSEDLDELLELSDRIVVMFEGELVYESKIDDADRTTIGYHMAGHSMLEYRNNSRST